jgi:hypothetical protein
VTDCEAGVDAAEGGDSSGIEAECGVLVRGRGDGDSGTGTGSDRKREEGSGGTWFVSEDSERDERDEGASVSWSCSDSLDIMTVVDGRDS